MNGIAGQPPALLQLFFQRLQIQEVVDVLPFRLDQFLENMLSASQLPLCRSVGTGKVVSSLGGTFKVDGALEFTVETKNVEDLVDKFGDLVEFSTRN